MANLTVSEVCNMACPFCFAGYHTPAARASADSAFLSLDDFERRLDFLDRSNINDVRLMGGEPTLHPQFVELVQRTRQRHKKVVVFTNGVMPETALRCLEELPVEACRVLVNMNSSRKTGGHMAEDLQRRGEVLRRLGQRAFPGYTIFSPNFQLEPLVQAILDSDCRKAIRVGLAQPMTNSTNVYLHPKQYPLVGQRLAEMARAAAEVGIQVELDCGFVHCMFSQADFEFFMQSAKESLFHCNAILDIGLDDHVIHCFPLAGQKAVQLEPGVTDKALREELHTIMQPYRAAGIYKECSTCHFKSNAECTGGCLAGTLLRFRQATLHLVVPESAKWALIP